MTKRKDSIAIFSDKPTDKDLLRFEDYSKLLAKVIINSETPSTIGIFGEWGSGKTSLLLMIDKLLQKKKIKTIWFNAWKYDKEEALWRALILSVLRELSAEHQAIDETTLRLYEAVSTEKLGQMQIDWLEIGKAVLKSVLFFMSPLILIPGLADAFADKSFLDRASSAFSRKKIQQSRERISSIEQFEELYRKLIDEHTQDGTKVVILIDDLDRCIPVRALEVLEALKSFLDAPGCVYVVACDTRLINHGLRAKYDGESDINLDEYLAKIIQFSFPIPPIRGEDAERFIQNFGLSISSDEINRLITTAIDRNPRKLKRFLSDMKIKIQLVKARKLLMQPDVLVKMSCVANVWKEFWQASINSPSVFERAQKLALNQEGLEKSEDDIEFGRLFHIDEKLNNFLRTDPQVSLADLQDFIFLSSTTTATPLEQQILRTMDLLDRAAKKHQTKSDAAASLNVFGREQEIEQLKMAIKEGAQLILLVGPAGIGKTTLLKKLDALQSNNFVTIYIDLKLSWNFRGDRLGFLYELARLISQAISDKGYSIRFQFNKDQFTAESFSAFLQNVSPVIKDRHLVIIMDDVDSFSKETSEFIFDNIRYILRENKRVTTLLSCRSIISEFSHSSWKNFSRRTVVLRAMSKDTFRTLFENMTSLPINYFDIGQAYTLLYLFENELRVLISKQFTKFHWWQQGLIQDLSKRNDDLKHSLDYLSLGDLFRLILAGKNWDKIFKEIFPDREFIEERVPIVLSARNAIAHSRNLTDVELVDFVTAVKEMLDIIHKVNFG